MKRFGFYGQAATKVACMNRAFRVKFRHMSRVA